MILGIDYGLKNIGLAVSQGSLASPVGTIKPKNINEAIIAIEHVVQKWSINKIVVGISEGKSKEAAQSFGKKLQTMLRLNVEYIDETLSSKEASTGRKKDKEKEHTRAAAIILQRWLDNQN